MYAVVTGASSGIGLECAKILANRGYDLVLVARRKERLIKLQKKLEEHYGIHVIVMPYDLSNVEECKELYQACRSLPVEILVNNAGFGKVGMVTEIVLDEELKMIDTNIKALHILTKLFAQSMATGSILNVASIAAFQPVPLMATYAATKSYVLSMTKAMNYEMRRQHKNVHICALCPGPVDTEFDQVANVKYSLKHISAKECAKAGIKGMFQKKMVIFPIASTKFISKLSKVAPDEVVLNIEYFLQNKKR